MKTLADFKPPYSALFLNHPLFGRKLALLKNGELVASFDPHSMGEQACVAAAFDHAYGSDTPSELDTLREVNAELLKALQTISRMTVLTDDVVNRHTLVGCVETARAAIQKAEGR